MIEVAILPGAAAIGTRAADAFDAEVAAAPEPVLGVATGSSPDAIYAELVRRHGGGENPYRSARLFLLDEYIGLPADHPERYRAVIRRQLTDPLGIDPARVCAPDADGSDTAAAGAVYEEAIRRAGGIGLQLLGIGANGHIAFNEPGSAPESRTRAIELTDRTRADNARFFGGDVDAVPRRAMSQGIGTILRARRLLLIATGTAKADAIAAMLHGPATPEVPASALHGHPAVTVLLDPAAAAGIDAARLPGTVRVIEDARVNLHFSA